MVVVVVVVGALHLARSFLVPLLIGILTSYTLSPLVNRLHSRRLPRPLAAALVPVLLTGSALVMAVAAGVPATCSSARRCRPSAWRRWPHG